MLGKRKREAVVARDRLGSPESVSPDRSDTNTHDVFRKYFEAQFDPLPETTSVTARSDRDSDDDTGDTGGLEDLSADDDDFLGFSDQEETHKPTVEVIDTTADLPEQGNSIDKIFMKSFMSSRPPRDTEPDTQSKSKNGRTPSKEDDEDATNLKNDLDLQRLLRESHLLSQSVGNSSSASTSLHGKQRHQATDMRMLDLGSKSSLFTQDKMPMSHRKGIRAKAGATEAHRRQDAKENGVILEKAKSKKDVRNTLRRERGVDVPVLGRFKNGTLSLSKRDVASIQGPSNRGGKKKRGRR